MYRQPMIRQTRVRLLVAAAAIAGLLAVSGLVATIASGGPSASKAPPRMSAEAVIDVYAQQKMAEAGIFITDGDPPDEPRVSLGDAATYLRVEAGVVSERGALVLVNTVPAGRSGGYSGFLRGTLPESLVWAINIDTSASTVPDLFDPQASHSIAFVDALGGGLLGVLTQ